MPKADREKSVQCESWVVHEIPLACVFKDVGQNSKCLSDRQTEHRRNVKIKPHNLEAAKHAQDCSNCTIQWTETEVMHKKRNDIKIAVSEREQRR